MSERQPAGSKTRWPKRMAIVAALLVGVWFAGNVALDRMARGGGVRVLPGVQQQEVEVDHARSTSSGPPAGYWEAVAQLDVPGALRLSTSQDESDLASCLGRVLEADLTGAIDDLKALHNGAVDPRVAAAAADALGQLLMFDARWEEVLDLAGRDPGVRDRGTLDEGDVIFARAMKTQPPERIVFGEGPARLSAGRTRFGQPTVVVMLNDCRREFVIDTGAGFSALASDVAGACGVEPLGDEVGLALTSTSNTVGFRPALVERLSIGELVVENHPVAILDKADLEFHLGPIPLLKVDGILGWPLFRDIAFDIDYDGGETVLSRSAGDDGTPRNLFWLGYPLSRLSSAEGLPLQFGLDTGAVTTSIRATLLDKVATGPVRESGGFRMGAGGGEAVNKRTVKDIRFHLGGHVLHFDRLSTSDGVKNSVLWHPDGRLGSDIARGGRLIIDYRRGRMELIRPN